MRKLLERCWETIEILMVLLICFAIAFAAGALIFLGQYSEKL